LYYGAGASEAELCVDDDVSSSARQFRRAGRHAVRALRRRGDHVVRGQSLKETISAYHRRSDYSTKNIDVLTNSEVTDLRAINAWTP